MEEIETPTEQIQEQLEHQALHSGDRWFSRMALSSALLAVFAAISALLSGHHVNEAMMEQIHASDQWAFYQAKAIKSSIQEMRLDLMKEKNEESAQRAKEKIEKYQKEQSEIKESAEEKEHLAEKHMRSHLIFARAVTLFQVAIAIAAISALVRRKKFWYLSLGLGGTGLLFLVQGLYGSL